MKYLLNIPNYKAPVSFLVNGQKYSLEQTSIPAEYPDQDWAVIKKDAAVKDLIDAKLLHILDGSTAHPEAATPAPTPPPSTPALPPADLSEVRGDDLDTTIDATTDIPTLERWLNAETRTTVKRKLNERISELKG